MIVISSRLRFNPYLRFDFSTRSNSVIMYLVSRTTRFARLFFLVIVSGLFVYLTLGIYTVHRAFTTIEYLNEAQNKIVKITDSNVENRFENDLKYMLLWAGNDSDLYSMGEGQTPFIDQNCSHLNCFLTTDKNLLSNDYTNFDAIVIELPLVMRWQESELPQRRTGKQKYIFRSMSPALKNPVCNPKSDGYFNWTWTYKLYSDIFNPNIEVVDLQNSRVAPKLSTHWPSTNIVLKKKFTDMDLKILQSKNKAVAWVIPQCRPNRNFSINYANYLKGSIEKLGLKFDIYGCGNRRCDLHEPCADLIKREYFFYLVFEDVIDEDYLTAEVLKAYDNYAVPIIISGADLKIFLPPNSYIDARFVPADTVAAIVNYSIKNSELFNAFHFWRNHYRIRKVDSGNGLCRLCSYLSNAKIMSRKYSYDLFRVWWYTGSLNSTCSGRSGN